MGNQTPASKYQIVITDLEHGKSMSMSVPELELFKQKKWNGATQSVIYDFIDRFKSNLARLSQGDK